MNTISVKGTGTGTGTDPDAATDEALLPSVISVVQKAGEALLARRDANIPIDIPQIVAALRANDVAVLETLRPGLLRLRSTAGWVEDEGGTGLLPRGEWWVTDPAEGNINLAHGLDEWAVTATLVRDNVPVLTVVHQPQYRRTYAAVRGAGAWMNERPLRVSAKQDLSAAMVGTGQAVPGESAETYERIGRSVTSLLHAALVVKVSVPATLQLVDVAAGRTDAFWQHSRVRSGLAAGSLLVAEAGGVVTDTHGVPWTPASAEFLAAAPGIHRAAVTALESASGSVGGVA